MKISKDKYEIALSRAGMTAADLRAAGISHTTVWRALQHGGEARPTTVGKIAKALGVDVTDIIETE